MFKFKLSFVMLAVLYLLVFFFRFQSTDTKTTKTSLSPVWFDSVRGNLSSEITNLLPSPQAELLSGILLGEKKDLPGDFKLALRDTSTLHIVVVSGQNLSMVAGLLLLLSGFLKRRLVIIISFCAIIFYTLLTGAQVPVIRAAIMSSLALFAMILGRQKQATWILFMSAALMLLVNPLWINDLSFQLSFMATFGVVVLSPVISKLFNKLPGFIGVDLAVTISAQLMVIPIISQNFHQFSVVSVFTNLLVGWVVPIVMILGAAMLFLDFIFTPLGQVIAFFVNIFLTYFIYVVEIFASLPFAWEYVGEKSWIFWGGYYFVLSGILLAISRKFAIDSRRLTTD